MSTDEFEIVTDAPMQLGECPLWHPKELALYWVDIDGCAVHRYDPTTKSRARWSVPTEPGCIAWCASGGLIVALRSGLVLLDTATGQMAPVSDPPYDTTHSRFNDGRCDAAGRFWVGTIYEPRDQPLGTLFSVDRGVVTDIENPVTVSNGLAFGVDGRTLYHADTKAHQILAYDFDVETGSLGARRLFKQFSTDRAKDYAGRPDGAAVDSEGAYWCAMFEGGRVLRLSSSGEVLSEIVLPVRCPTMVAFGGPDLRTLYITSARHNRSPEEISKFPLSGHLLSMRVATPGLPEFPYIV